MNGKSVFALSRAGAAVIAAVILLACSGWAFLYLFGSPAEITQGAELEDGAYVSANVSYLMDICGVEREEGTGEALAYFAIAPVGDQFVIIRFASDDYDSIASFESETQGFLYGTQSSVSFHMGVTGMVRALDEDVAALLSSWFSNNATWMSQSGLIAAVEDYSTYLCPNMIDTASTGSVSTSAAVTLTSVAAVLLVYAAAEIILVACGVYKKKGGADA